jgi:nucleoside-diphosphate-sugar epimerase
MNPSPNNHDLRIAVTGAGGYLGKNLCRYFIDLGASVFQLSSNPATRNPSTTAAQFTFHAGVAKGYFSENRIKSLVHAAYDFRPRTREAIWDGNVKGSINLFAQARAEGVEQVVYISSMSAYDGCRSLYGSAKLEIEAALRTMGFGCSVRPGLIYSTPLAESGGMVGSLLKNTQRGVIPLVGRGDQVLYLVHQKDLAGLVEKQIKNPTEAGNAPIIAANPRPYTLREIIRLLAEAAGAGKPKVVPVPWKAAWAGLRMLEVARLNPEFRSDSILSLVHQNPNPDFSTIPEGITFRDFAATISNDRNNC